MPEKPDKSIQEFEWRLLSELSDLLNRLGRHGFRNWPESTSELQVELETLRADPERDIFLLRDSTELCGYALTLPEPDIRRLVASLAVTAGCLSSSSLLLDSVIARALDLGISRIHIAVRGVPVEPTELLKSRGFKVVTANLELTLDRADAGKIVDFPLPEGFSIRPMRSDAETLLLTRVQNAVFRNHWGFSKNSPEEIQARLNLPVTGPEHVLFVESPEGDIAGYIWTALEWVQSHTCGRVWMTGVVPRFRRSGIGRSIVTAGIKHLFAEGASDVHLEVIEDNRAAVRIYTQMGFKKAGRTEWYELKV